MNPHHRGQYQRERQFSTVGKVDKQEHRGERPYEDRQEAAEINQRSQPRRPFVTPADLFQFLLPVEILLAPARPLPGRIGGYMVRRASSAHIPHSIVWLPALCSLMKGQDPSMPIWAG